MKRASKTTDGCKNVKRSVSPKRKSSKKDPNANKQITTYSGKNMFVGMDVHKKFLQVAMMDKKAKVIFNERIENENKSISRFFRSSVPENAKIVMESSSVWYGLYRYMTDKMGYNVVLSNPWATKIIAASKKKTDKRDAVTLADLLRCGYISLCHVSNKDIVEQRQLVRYRDSLVKTRTTLKNKIHGILLQGGIKIFGATFTLTYNRKLRSLKDYRINGYLDSIGFVNTKIADSNIKVHNASCSNKDAMLLKTIPGIGDFISLILAAEIDGVERFSEPKQLKSYAGLAPSVRNSADVVHHGHITKRGKSDDAMGTGGSCYHTCPICIRE